MNELKIRTHCPVSFSLDHFGDKWTLLIVRDILLKGKRGFKEFLRSEEKIASNILTNRLRRLEASGIIYRRGDGQNKLKVNYFLTPRGLDLAPIILEIVRWSAKYDPDTETPEDFVRELEKDQSGLAKRLVREYQASLPE